MLSGKLEEFISISRAKRQSNLGHMVESNSNDPVLAKKERELRDSQRKIQYYKKEIDFMKNQLDGSYNIQKIMALENE